MNRRTLLAAVSGLAMGPIAGCNGTTERDRDDGKDELAFSGTGDETIEELDLASGLVVVDAVHETDGGFRVMFGPGDGTPETEVVDQFRPVDRTVGGLLDEDASRIMIRAEGDWEIAVRQPRPDSGKELPVTLEGTGDDFRGPFQFESWSEGVFDYEGDRTFGAAIYPVEGDLADGVGGSYGQSEGSSPFDLDGVGYVEVTADGEWTLELSDL